MKKKAMDMTKGPIVWQLVLFAFPLMVGNLFQLLYNTVDSLIVGNFVSMQALAAVGSTGPIINTLVGFFMGLSTGAGVVISQHFGAKDDAGVHAAVHTTILLVLILGVVFTFLGVWITPFMLRFNRTPADVFQDSAAYLRIYFAGILGLMLYNMGSGVLRAVGDSRRPLYFLIFSSILNVGLDLLFVLAFHLGIRGVAYATIISQWASAILVLYVLSRTHENYRLILKDLRIDPAVLRSVIRVGIPAAIQQAITAFSNVFVQSYINSFGSACMAGWTCYSKIDQYVLLPVQSLALASTTFVGQNVGARQMSRAQQGIRVSMILSISVTAVLSVLLMLFARPMIRLFNKTPEVLEYGTMFLRVFSPFYTLCCINQILAGALRGTGDSKGPMYIMLCSFVLFRQIYLYIGTRFIKSVMFVGFGYPVGWLVCSVWMLLHYFRKRKQWKTNPPVQLT